MAHGLEAELLELAATLAGDVTDQLTVLELRVDGSEVVFNSQGQLAISVGGAGGPIVRVKSIVQRPLDGGPRSGQVESERNDSAILGSERGVPATVDRVGGVGCQRRSR